LDLKTALPKLNPEFLCIYFTNNWNPVSLRGEKTYGDFVLKSREFIHLKINVDKYPKLKWYFDSKFEPGCHLYYYGVNLKNIGGINFERNTVMMSKIVNQLRNSSSLFKAHELQYSQPYYEWEANIPEYGVKAPDEKTQTYVSSGFRGLTTFTSGLFTDDKYAHVRTNK
jgi:hypothetical protein